MAVKLIAKPLDSINSAASRYEDLLEREVVSKLDHVIQYPSDAHAQSL
jgi:hypothetical protein